MIIKTSSYETCSTFRVLDLPSLIFYRMSLGGHKKVHHLNSIQLLRCFSWILMTYYPTADAANHFMTAKRSTDTITNDDLEEWSKVRADVHKVYMNVLKNVTEFSMLTLYSGKLIAAAAMGLRDLGYLDECIQELISLIDSKQVNNAKGAAAALKRLLPSYQCKNTIVEQLLDRLHGRIDTLAFQEVALVLSSCGHQQEVKEVIFGQLDIKVNPNVESNRFKQVVEVITRLNMMEDLGTREIVINHFIALLQQKNTDHWLEMEIIQAIQSLNLRDPRVVWALEACLHHESESVNSNGVRSASVKALKSFGIEPPGRGCWEILWTDKLKRGKTNVFRVQVGLVITALLTFTIMFFTMLFPEIQALARSQQSLGTIILAEVQMLPGTCKETVCYEAYIQVLYTPEGYTRPFVGHAQSICTGTEAESDCEKFAINTTLTVYYDPEHPSVVFVSKDHTSYYWRMKVLHTTCWPCFIIAIPVLSMWPLIMRSWIQSRDERGKPRLSFQEFVECGFCRNTYEQIQGV